MSRSRHPYIPACQEDMIRTRASREAHFHSNDSIVRTFSQPAFHSNDLFSNSHCFIVTVMLSSDMFAAAGLPASCSSCLAAAAPVGPRCRPSRKIQSVFAASGFLRSSSVVDPPLGDAIPTVRDANPARLPRANQPLVGSRRMLTPRALAAQEVFQNEHLHKKGGGGVPIRMV